MTLSELSQLIKSGQFHHATHRHIGQLAEGIFIYRKDPSGFRGYRLVGSFGKHFSLESEYEQVELMLRNTGYSVSAYGQG